MQAGVRCEPLGLRAAKFIYTLRMTLTLDSRLEKRIQQRIEDGSHGEPSEVIDHALDLLEADETWSDAEKAELDQRLTESMAQIQRGEGIPGHKVREVLAGLRASRAS